MYPLNSYVEPDFHFYPGEDVQLRVHVINPDGTDKNLAASTVTLRIGDLRAGITALIKSCEIVGDGTAGLVQAVLSDIDTDGLDVRTYNYQFIATDTNGNTQIVKSGLLKVYNVLPST